MVDDYRNQNWENAGELLVYGVASILSVFPETAPVGAGAAFVLLARQNERLNKFIRTVKQKFEQVDHAKLDKPMLHSDEFTDLVFQNVDAASKTASDIKQEALANILINASLLPTSKISGKLIFTRLVSQMSDEEMYALRVIYNEEPRVLAKEKADGIKCYTSGYQHPCVGNRIVSEKLGWNVEDATVACQGLLQLCLVSAVKWDGIRSYHLAVGWRITELAKKLVTFVLDPTLDNQYISKVHHRNG